MSVAEKVARNTLFSAASFGSNIILLVIVIVAARKLGVEDYGKYAAVLAFVTLFEPLSDFGMRKYFAKEIARDKSKAQSAFANMVGIRIMLGMVALGTIFVIANVVGYSSEMIILVNILAVAMLLRSFKFGIRAFLQAFDKYSYEAILLIFERLITVLVALIVLFLDLGLVIFVLVFPLVRILDIFITLKVFKMQVVVPGISFDMQAWKEILKCCLPYALILGLGVLYSRIDIVMLSVMRPIQEAGLYSAAYTFIDILDMVPGILAASIFPTLSVLAMSDRISFVNLCQRTVRYLILAALPLMISGFLIGPELILLVFGSDYHAAAPVLRILLLSLVFSYLSSVGAIYLYSVDLQKQALLGMAIAVTINVILNYLLIPIYGYIGAAIGTAVAQVTACIFMYGSLWRAHYRFELYRYIVKPFIVGFVAAVIANIFYNDSILLAFVLSIAAYLFLIITFKVIDDVDIRTAKKLLIKFL